MKSIQDSSKHRAGTRKYEFQRNLFVELETDVVTIN